MGFRVLVTGDRHWEDYQFIWEVLSDVATATGLSGHDITIIHGAAPGADTLADLAAYELGYAREPYPANWDGYHKAAGPIRNQQMLDEGHPDVVIAFHENLAESKGTKDMVTRARKAGIPVILAPIKEEA